VAKRRLYAYRKGTGGSETVKSVSEQLAALRELLVQDHPDLIAVGLGKRQRCGALVPETVVKLVVPEKLGRKELEVSQRLPRRVRLGTTVYGQKVSVWVPTDIEALPPMEPSFEVGQMKATALARWGDSPTRFGFITAGHGLPAPGATVEVQLVDGNGTGVVRERSNLTQTGLDVGLVEVPDGNKLLDTGPLTPTTLESQELEALVGSKEDLLTLSARSWAESGLPPMFAIAYYTELPIPTTSGTLTLRHALHCRSPFGIFTKSRSGGSWVSVNTIGQPHALVAIQSHGSQDAFDQGLGTDFKKALEWLICQSPSYADLTWASRKQDLF